MASATTVQAQDSAMIELQTALQAEFNRLSAQALEQKRGIIAGSDMSIEKQGNVYKVTLPQVNYRFPDGSRLVAENILLDATRVNDQSWKITAHIPENMQILDRLDIVEADVTIKNRRAIFVWHPEKGMIPRLDVNLGNIDIARAQENGSDESLNAKINSLRATLNLTRGKDGAWSGPGLTEISGFILQATSGAQENLTLAFDKMALKSAYRGLDLEGGAELKRQLNQASPSTAQEVEELTKTGAHYLKTFAADVSNDFTLTNARLQGLTRHGPIELKLEKLSSSISAQGLKDKTAKAHFSNIVQGMSIGGLTPAAQAFFPTDARMNVTIDRLPYGALFDIFEGIGETTTASPLDAMGEAGTVVRITDTLLQSASLKIEYDGTIDALPTIKSPLGMVGEMEIKITGLDESLSQLNSNPDLQNSVFVQGFGQIITMIQLAGQSSQSSDGKSVRSYKINADEKGRVLLNGVDIQNFTPYQPPPALNTTSTP